MNMLNCHERAVCASEMIGNKRQSKTPSHSEYLLITVHPKPRGQSFRQEGQNNKNVSPCCHRVGASTKQIIAQNVAESKNMT